MRNILRLSKWNALAKDQFHSRDKLHNINTVEKDKYTPKTTGIMIKKNLYSKREREKERETLSERKRLIHYNIIYFKPIT